MNQAPILSFASLNINGTKDKDLLINELLVHDIHDISTTCSSLVNQAVKNLRVAYGKISPNKSRYNRNGLCMIYNAYCAPVLLFLSGMAHLFRKKDRHTLRTAYFRYCKFLLRLPRWHRNKK